MTPLNRGPTPGEATPHQSLSFILTPDETLWCASVGFASDKKNTSGESYRGEKGSSTQRGIIYTETHSLSAVVMSSRYNEHCAFLPVRDLMFFTVIAQFLLELLDFYIGLKMMVIGTDQN